MKANNLYSNHLQRVKDAVNNVFALSQLDKWIEKNTYLDNKKFTFTDFEFQRDIIADDSPTSNVIKCAQVGLSEIMARWAVAACVTQDNFTVIYTFPTTTDAEKFCKTRLDPCIAGSPELQREVSKSLNNAEIKQFGANSFVYFKGTISETQALSVPADVIIHDEVDKSNLTQMSVYVSRLLGRPTKRRKLFSTPTVDKYGISKEADTSRRMRQVWQCSCCNHHFFPDYFNDVKIPGYDKDKREINKDNLKNIRWEEAIFLCPRCGRAPSTEPQYRSWVCENPAEAYPSKSWFVTPFSAPNKRKPSDLVKNSTEFDKFSEFMNQCLGLTDEDKNESITVSDVENALIHAELKDSSIHFMGSDMGMLCTITIGRLTLAKELLVVHREIVPHTRYEKRRLELMHEFKIAITVMDSQPYIDMATRICNGDANAYASNFTTGTPGVMYVLKEQEEDPIEGVMNMRRLNVTRTLAFDHLMAELKARRILVKKQEELDDTWKKQLRSLKRVGKFDKSQAVTYHWEKTDKNDHFHFSLLYLMLACLLRARTTSKLNYQSVPLVSSFKVKQR